ncbi:S-layer region-like protein [Trichormus variabilis ATCC 29413]|uniref:S-layer region-like protein n=2 Tax=Anabaena variabilis TaxID=264691 RepID=Q3MCE6_TRIV2|nr:MULTISPECIES: S-layer homology domain-containing protein [Nostocaceae]ABA21340.1 S-layer region-like protein [Trichormus variabilis ATCC 29413]MBC1213659.1 S-layer homology domain-containing protein [Trichormus variabilis ARAD]MBC1254010.1 S-layer homology domain-containing protein [Trichormus variabilis V5]MBC1267747.1 S-layer homology domain-containing protein [Trichormus variabilis FSR]MBC1302117.1 S-layer homology domain-containing protein [Trichormus variabilis N2B]
MFNLTRWQSGTSALMALSITAGTVAPFLVASPSFAQTTFSDVSSNYWAAQFIQQLSQRGIIAGFPDGSFRPEEPVTRAQFAAMVNKAFQKAPERQAINFVDVPSNYWASSAIRQAYTIGFLSGYPGNRFEPNQAIPRQQVLVSLANGLEYIPSGNVESTLQYFNDAVNVAGYARSPIAAATEQKIVVNYPNVNFLNPTATATRAQVAAFIYQALVSSNQASAITSPYIVATQANTPRIPTSATIPQGTVISVKYDKAEKILVTKDETAPLTLTVDENVVTQAGTVVIPAGSQVVGELKPAQGGSQFVAQKLVLTTGQEYQLNATSEVINKTETVRKGASTGTIIKNTVLGAGAAAAVSAVTGDRAIATEEVLGGAAIGGLIGLFFGRNSVDLIAIDPDTDLQMTINQSLLVSLR